jgi:hypothetical protein
VTIEKWRPTEPPRNQCSAGFPPVPSVARGISSGAVCPSLWSAPGAPYILTSQPQMRAAASGINSGPGHSWCHTGQRSRSHQVATQDCVDGHYLPCAEAGVTVAMVQYFAARKVLREVNGTSTAISSPWRMPSTPIWGVLLSTKCRYKPRTPNQVRKGLNQTSLYMTVG